MRRWLGLALLTAAGCSLLTAPVPQRVRVRGSDTMLELNRRLAETFMRGHSGVAVLVDGGGTGAGVASLVDGSVDLAAASRPFTAEEIAALHASRGTLGVRFLVARDALSVLVNPLNPVRDLSSAQLTALFSGTVRRWSEVGGDDREVVVVLRPPSSGTYWFFRNHVLHGGEYAAAALTLARPEDVVAAVTGDPAATGYGALIGAPGVVRCAIDGVPPTTATVRDGSYPLARYLYLYAAAPPEGTVREYVDWCVGPAGQAVVADVGFLPLWLGR